MERESLVRKLAAFIYATAVLEQSEETSCHVYFKDIEKYFGKENLPENWRTDIDLLIDIQNELDNYPGCKDNSDACWLDIPGYDEYGSESKHKVSKGYEGFNMCLYTDYIADMLEQ